VRIGIVGATGVVGRELLSLLPSSQVKITTLRLSASSGSVGKKLFTPLGEQEISELNEEFFTDLDSCFFCVSNEISRVWIPAAVAMGVVCIDNSSAFRMAPEVPLIVPEVNGHLLKTKPLLIANPNCCAAPLTSALAPLQRTFGLEEVWVSTYQAVSGAGNKALQQLNAEVNQYPYLAFKPEQFLFNVLPCIGSVQQDGHCQEEIKIVQETRKILTAPQLAMAATAARVPVFRGHCLAVSFCTTRPAEATEIRQCLAQASNLLVQDDMVSKNYPQPAAVQKTNQVYIGRIRGNRFFKGNSFSMWIVADNLRAGAAHNALKILETVQGLL